MADSRARTVMLVCSAGGHLAQLQQIESLFATDRRRWVTTEVANLEVDDDVILCHFPTTRNLKNLARNLVLAARVMAADPPDLVFSTGAGPAVPFILMGRLLGIRTAFLEVIDRIDSPTLTGRLVKPFTDEFLLQWPSQRQIYQTGTVVGPTYPLQAEQSAATSRDPNQPPKVYVTVGTDQHQFDRLVRWSAGLTSSFDVFAQTGTSEVPGPDGSVQFAPARIIEDQLRTADAVICHGGPSSIAEAWAHGHRPIVVPRDPELGEHVDDHQLRYARFLDERGLIRLAQSEDDLNAAVAECLAAGRAQSRTIAAPDETLKLLKLRLDAVPQIGRRARLLRRLFGPIAAKRTAAAAAPPAHPDTEPMRSAG